MLPPAFVKVMFLHVSVILSRGGGVWGGVVSQHALQVSRPTPKGEVEGLAGGGGPHAHTWGVRSLAGGVSRTTSRGEVCIPACTESDTPLPSRRLLLRAVHILLECIPVTGFKRTTPSMHRCSLNAPTQPTRPKIKKKIPKAMIMVAGMSVYVASPICS